MRIDMSGSEWFASRPGGLNRYFQSLFTALSTLDNVAVEATAFGDAPSAATGTHSWGPTGGGTLSRVRASRHRANPGFAPDVVDRHFSLYGAPARAYRGNPLHVTHFQGPWAAESQAAGAGDVVAKTKRELEKIAYRAADHFIVLSQSFKSVLIDDYGMPADRISIIPPGVDIEDFAFQPEPSTGAPIVLCVRRLERRMGIDVLIRAWESVVTQVPDAQLHIVGTGTFEAELKSLALEQPHSSSIVFSGRLPDGELRAKYAAATVTTVPSLALEGFGLIALESLAIGRAAIVTDCGGLPDAVSGLDPSLIVAAGNQAALGDRIARALEGQRPSASECRNHAETFAWSLIAARHVDLYAKLAATNPPKGHA